MSDRVPIETDLIARAKTGDYRAFRSLVESNQSFVFAVAYKVLGNEEEALDAVQDSFLKIWKNLERFNVNQKFTTWVYKIVTNTCIDLLRKSKKSQQEAAEDCFDYYQADGSLIENYEDKEMVQVVYGLVNKLPEKQRLVFVLRDLEGLEMDEVSEILGMSGTVIKSNLYHARIQMRSMIEKIYSESKKEEK